MKELKLMLGDNISSLKKLPDNCIDSIITDPPYGLSFMSKKWDYDVPSVEFWKEILRVLKPGGHILSFGGTRTYHRMVVNIEDAGFEIRDQIQWIYGSGFPKSLNIVKAVDKLNGNEREDFGVSPNARNSEKNNETLYIDKSKARIIKGKSEFEGWGTALKPANEPICLARKPLSEKSVAENVLKWRTGGINVDGCRIGSEIIMTNMKNTKGGLYNLGNEDRTNEVENTFNEGRFPANLILECCCNEVIKGEKGEIKRIKSDGGNTENRRFGNGKGLGPCETNAYTDKGDIHTNPMCPCSIMDEQSGDRKGFSGGGGNNIPFTDVKNTKSEYKMYNDKGGASRFFYQAKVSKAERNMGLDDFEDKTIHDDKNKYEIEKFNTQPKKNNHPTVKPINLMSYLCKLITPEGGIVLDPFMGSGSTGIAARLEGFRFLGMEMDEDYFKIAETRIEKFEDYRKFKK